jgi:T5SS/PEP-CTERM-associated repeat protein
MQQIKRQFSMVVLLTSTWAGIQPAAAQYTSNYQTNTISGVTNNWADNYVVGSNTFANALLIRNGGVLTNADGCVGYLPASSSNYVMVAGASSVWSNANLYLGYSGGGNSLVISNAGRVANSLGTYVANDATSSSNHVLVTGANSAWDCANNLALGLAGSGNSLVISNDGRVSDSYSQLGSTLGSSGNNALITGTGSVWSNTSSCTIGLSGSNNKMTINKGGRMVCNFATLGSWDTSTNNSMLVSDSGSLWDDSAEASVITFGANGSGNSLIVTNGGQVKGYYAYFGRFASSNNSALVTGPGSSFSVNCYIYTGNQGHDNSFTVANGAAVSDKFCYISYEAGSTNNAVLVTGTNSSWQNSYSVFVGFDGGGGSLTLSNGATMSTGGAFAASHDGTLGVDSTSRNNRALVTGGGSVWNCADNLYVGLNGPGNNLVISNGGRVINTDGYVGSNPGSDNNRALVTGTNSVWTNSADFYVGDFSVGNSLVISNGGRVINGYGYLGRVAGSDNNSVMIVGTNSVWTNHANLYVGCYGSGNSLVISNGGRVIDDYGTVGYDTNCFNNQALVAGAGSVWSNSTVVFVGDFGSTNSLTIRNGGLVTDYYGLVGEEESGNDNTVYMESGGVWRNQELCVGDLGSHNAMFVDGGSVFVTTYMAVGYDPLYYNNLVELDNGQIVVTNQTHNAELEVYGGGFLLAGGTLIVDNLVITNDGAQFMHIGGTLIYRTLQIDPAQDTDSDGIPNGWEQAHGLDPLNPDDAEADADGDGVNNLQEYLAGTNPTNATSCFKITSLTLTNGSIRVRWSAVGGRHYVVQTNSDMGTGFSDASPVIAIPGAAEMVTNYLDPGAATNSKTHYYRIRLAP